MAGKVAIVTGGNSGIGCETVKALASAGCRVIMASRSMDNAQNAIKTEITNPGYGGYTADAANVVPQQLDLADLKSVKAFADDMNKEKQIDFLVFNAGILAPPLTHTSNGWESQMATNHFGHFYLFSLLRDKLANQMTPSRLVVVSSALHNYGSVNVDDLHFAKGRSYSGFVAYGQSKKANILFTKSVSDQFKGTKVSAVCLHPGVIKTNLAVSLSPFVTAIMGCILDKTIPQGAATTVYGCLSPDADTPSGSYLFDCNIATPDKEAQDEGKQLRQALWTTTETQLKEALVKNKL